MLLFFLMFPGEWRNIYLPLRLGLDTDHNAKEHHGKAGGAKGLRMSFGLYYEGL